ncbi:hypothetical protein V8V91_12205 [Algoriphagus halophilus]|uniref:hypothetical protein n=1 Tax=Algoriphagus halophilus TaxID=226505 RepID=UPI00358E0158
MNRAPTLMLFKDYQRKKLDSLDQLILQKEKILEEYQVSEIKDYVGTISPDKLLPKEIASYSFESFEKIKKEKKRRNPFAEEEAEEYKTKTAKEKAKIDSLKKANKKRKKNTRKS